MEVLARFNAKVDTSQDCWLWTGGDTGNGLRYGKFWDGTRKVLAHRYAYSINFGDIPEGLEVDHVCRVPKCVRPDHLRLLTRTQNMRNRNDCRLKADGKIVCNRGHEISGNNVYTRPDGRIECRVCIHRPNARNKKD